MKKKKISKIEAALLPLVGLVLIWFYIGFYFPDPYSSHRFGEKFISLLLLALRIGLPIMYAGALALYILFKTGAIAGKNIALLFLTLGALGLIGYPLSAIAYGKFTQAEEKKSKYHPYLQLKPPLIPDEMYQAAHINIACLGGSTTEYLDSHGRGWPDRLQELLRNEAESEAVSAYNLGREWYTTLHSLINYQVNIRQRKPDILLVMHSINDLLHNADKSYFSHGTFRPDYGHFYGPVNRIILDKPFLADVLSSIRLWYAGERQEIVTDVFPGLDSFCRNLNTLIDLALLDSAHVVLLTQPYLYKEIMPSDELNSLHMVNVESYGPELYWGHRTALEGMRQYNDAIREVARDRGIALIDLEKAVPKTLEFFWDDVHYNNVAYDLIAETIGDELLASGVFSRSPVRPR